MAAGVAGTCAEGGLFLSACNAGSTSPNFACCISAILSRSLSCLFWNSFSGLYGFGTKGFERLERSCKGGGVQGAGLLASSFKSLSSGRAIRRRWLSREIHSSYCSDQVSKLTLTASALDSTTLAAHHPSDHSTRRRTPGMSCSGKGLGVSGSFVKGRKCFSLSYCSAAERGPLGNSRCLTWPGVASTP